MPRQREFRDEVYKCLGAAGLVVRVLRREEWSNDVPLRPIQQVISECSGAIVLAFERDRFAGPGPVVRSESGADIRLATVWNHIEAALAYTRGLPVLVIAEHGLRSEGLLESRYDWSVYWTNLDPVELSSGKFRGWLDPWRRQLRKASVTRVDPEKLTLGDILSSMRISHAWGVVSALVGCLAAVAAVAYRIGGGAWPWK